MTKSRIYSLAVSFAVFLFAVFVAVWFYVSNRYSVLFYHEQIQLFRFDELYFRSYLDRPGGLSGYLGAFLTQFYYYPVAGCIIIATVLSAVVLLFYHICRSCGAIGRLFFMPFIPAVLLMMSFVNIHFDMSVALGLLFALAGFRWYVAMPLPVRYGAGPALFTVLYFIAGGNALLLMVMILIFEITSVRTAGEKKMQSKNRYQFLYITLLLIWSALLPWMAMRMVYTVTVAEAYFTLTPGNFLFPTNVNKALWISFPALYLIWMLVAGKISHWNVSSWKLLVPNCLLVAVMVIWGAHSATDRRAEMLNRMNFDLQHGNWDSVMALGRAFPGNNRLACYLTNIALAESGQMPYRMFHYKQMGVAGLFLDWQQTYFTMWYHGEIYHRMGMTAEAEHSAFEALVTSPKSGLKEPNAATLRRLALTNIERRDSITACKYLNFFDNSFAYRKWAQQQRAHLASAMADSTFHIPEMPTPSRHRNFFIAYQYPDYSLLMLLESNPRHRLAFGYLMSYYMLQKDVEMVKWCFDNFFRNFDYPDIPTHYEEALIVYQNAMQESDDFFNQYPVSRATRDRFERYEQGVRTAQSSKRQFELFQKQFGNTYWFYVHFINPSSLQKKDEQNRY